MARHNLLLFVFIPLTVFELHSILRCLSNVVCWLMLVNVDFRSHLPRLNPYGHLFNTTSFSSAWCSKTVNICQNFMAIVATSMLLSITTNDICTKKTSQALQ